MSQAPAMPVFTDALIGDTTHLTTEEFGAYLLILFAYWRNNGVPLADDDRRLARIARVSTYRWTAKIRPAIVGFFDLSEGVWFQKRLDKEFKFISKTRAVNEAKGNRGAEAKWRKNKETVLAQGNLQGMATHTQYSDPYAPTGQRGAEYTRLRAREDALGGASHASAAPHAQSRQEAEEAAAAEREARRQEGRRQALADLPKYQAILDGDPAAVGALKAELAALNGKGH